MEAPLSEGEAKAQQKMWMDSGGFSFPSVEPAQHLINRCWREFQKRNRSLDELVRMRSAQSTPAIDPETRKQFGDMSIILGGGSKQVPNIQIDSVLHFFRAVFAASSTKHARLN